MTPTAASASPPCPPRKAFTVIELLVVVSIIALLVGILLPAIGRARDQAKLVYSAANLRNLGVAHQSYAATFADRQFTLVLDTIASYGSSVAIAFETYYQSNGGDGESHSHSGPILGWGYLDHTGPYRLFIYRTHERNDQEEWDGQLNAANCSLNLPIAFRDPIARFGSFRLINVQQFHQFVSGKFYDRVFYAPKDTLVLEAITGGGHGGLDCFDDPGAYCDRPDVAGQGEIPAWSSYVLSPAAMFNPEVMSHDDPLDERANGWVDPWSLPGGFRSPSFSQCAFPALKTHMLEHHWLQARAADCNPSFDGGPYVCEPYYFNHAWESSPVTLFYDGHVEPIGVRRTMRADGRVREQTGNAEWGLWSQDVSDWRTDGYFIDAGYDRAATSFHILTTDGIRGRDVVGD